MRSILLSISVLMAVLVGCTRQQTPGYDPSLTSAVAIPPQEQDALAYLSIDSNYVSIDEKVRYEELKAKFLNTWYSDANCYRGQAVIQKAWWKFYQQNTKEIVVSNILHTSNYDTLLVLVSWYAAEEEGTGIEKRFINGRTVSVGMGVVCDSSGNWNYRCDGGTSWIHSEGNKLAENELMLKETILKKGYLNSFYQPDPAFWKKLYEEKYLLSRVN